MLFAHQLKVFLADSKNPLLRTMKLQQKILKNKESSDSEIEFCLNKIDNQNLVCQMKANSITELLNCQNAKKFIGNKEQSKSSLVNKSNTTKIEYSNIEISEKNCHKSYDHMLNILKKAPGLDKRSDREKLLNHWKSQTAKAEFNDRCKEVFVPDDLGCILNAEDIIVLQACLIVIERE